MNSQNMMKIAGFVFVLMSNSWAADDQNNQDIGDKMTLEAYLQRGTMGYKPPQALDLSHFKKMSEEDLKDQQNLFDDNVSGPWQYDQYGRPYKIWGKKTPFPKIQPTIVEKENSVTFIFHTNTKGATE